MPFYVDDPDASGQKVDVVVLQGRDPLQALEPVLIVGWLKRDTWSRREALLLLAGYDPNTTQWIEVSDGLGQFPAGNIGYLDGITQSAMWSANVYWQHPRNDESYEQLLTLANYARGGSLDERKAPQGWIAWATSKGFVPYWSQSGTRPSSNAPSKPGNSQPRQEAEIKRVLGDLGYDLASLPKGGPGKPGPKKAARDKLPWMTKSVFDKAWERLRSNGEIKDGV